MKFALILAGCGQHDGSETHEVILTLLSMAQEGISWDAFAPDIKQHHVTNHLSDTQETTQSRDVLTESARLVRGKIKPVSEVSIKDYDGIIFPGGVGAVTNLCNWYEKGKDFVFHSDIKKIIDDCVSEKKPMGFICIAPVMIPKIYKNAKLTIGNDDALAKQITELGSEHINCNATDIVVDKQHKVVSTPANMVAHNINEVYIGIHKFVKELALLAN